MNTVEQIIKNEPLEEIVTVFALLKAPPHLDMMIRRYNTGLVQHGELEKTYTRLFEAGILTSGKKRPLYQRPKLEGTKIRP